MSIAALQPNLTPSQQIRMAEEAAFRVLARRHAAEALEAEKDQFLGQGAVLDQQVEDVINSGQFVSQAELGALLDDFLTDQFPQSQLVLDEEEPCATLEMDARLREYMRMYVEKNRLTNRMSPQFRRAITEKSKLAFTFDSDLARTRPPLDFVTIRHPLADAALWHLREEHQLGIPASRVVVRGVSSEAGTGYFFIFLVDVKSANSRTSLYPIIVLDDGGEAVETASQLLRSLQDSSPAPSWLTYSDDDFFAAKDRADSRIAAHRREAQAEATKRNAAILAAKSTAIRNSFEAKISRTLEIRDAATNESIYRMKDSEARNLEVRKRLKLEELESMRDVSVTSRLVIGGRILINSEIGVSPTSSASGQRSADPLGFTAPRSLG